MKTYVLGAGASFHAGYPLTRDMGNKLFAWMQTQSDTRIKNAGEWFAEEFGPVTNVEEFFLRVQDVIDNAEDGTSDQKYLRTVTAHELPHLLWGMRAWFSEIRAGEATAYQKFASNIVNSGDSIITFNYDVSLDRELHLAGKWEIGDGYGFVLKGLPADSPIPLLKLHGSTNWLALLFEGKMGFFQVSGPPRGVRPVIASAEIDFLGYRGFSDPLFTRPSACDDQAPMILPAGNKKFLWEDVWSVLWEQAGQCLHDSQEIFILGYSLAPVDGRACDLLFCNPLHNARIEISSGLQSGDIASRFRQRGFINVVEARESYFESWVNDRD